MSIHSDEEPAINPQVVQQNFDKLSQVVELMGQITPDLVMQEFEIKMICRLINFSVDEYKQILADG